MQRGSYVNVTFVLRGHLALFDMFCSLNVTTQQAAVMGYLRINTILCTA